MIRNTATVAERELVHKYETVIDGYLEDVLGGRILTGKWEQAACQRYLDDLKDHGHRFRFDKVKAAKACSFFPKLRVTDGPKEGQRFHLFPIQAFFAWNVYGFTNLEDEYRRFREAYWTLARGNGKTPFGAANAIKVTAFDDPPIQRAQAYLCATKRDQAGLAFDDIVAFIAKSGLSKRMRALQHEVKIPKTGSFIKKLASDSKTSDGFRVYFSLFDEYHALQKQHQGFVNVIKTGHGKADQDLSLVITTAGDERSKIWIALDNMATNVLDRTNDFRLDRMFAMICRLDDDDDVLDIANYPKANPLMRHGIVKTAKIETQIEKARIDPEERRALTRFYANRKTESGARCITSDMWNRSACRSGFYLDVAKKMSRDPVVVAELQKPRTMPKLAGVTPHAGLDMGQTDDFASIAYCWRLGEVLVPDLDSEGKPKVDLVGNPVMAMKPTFAIRCDVYVAKANKRAKEQPLIDWINSGHVQATDSQWTDDQVMFRDFRRQVKDTGVKTLATDPNNTRSFALAAVNELGVETYPFLQSPHKYNEPIKELKRAMTEGRVFIEANPCVEWCFRNAVTKSDAKGHLMPDKENSADKIDPFVAGLMAFSEATFAETEKKSIYETRGPITF